MWPFNRKKRKKKSEKTGNVQQIPEKTYAQLKEEYRQLEIVNAEQEDQCAKDGLGWQDMLIKTREVKEKMAKTDKLMRKVQEPSLTYNKKWKGKKITLDDFITSATSKEITDTSGEGYYATETAKTDIRVFPTDVIENIYRTDFPYILWIEK